MKLRIQRKKLPQSTLFQQKISMYKNVMKYKVFDFSRHQNSDFRFTGSSPGRDALTRKYGALDGNYIISYQHPFLCCLHVKKIVAFRIF